MIHRMAILIAGAVLLSGCGDLLGTEGGMVVRTDRTAYAPGETIVISVENRGGDPVTFWHCGGRLPIAVDVRESGGWAQRGGAGYYCQLDRITGEITLRSGDEHQNTLQIDQAGTFRFRVLSRGDPAGGGIVSDRIRVGS